MKPGLQVPEVLIVASANIVVKAESVYVITIGRPPSPRLGDCLSFYRPRREQFYACRTISPTCRGMAYSAMELTVVLANPAPVGASWRVLCSYRSSFEGSGVVVGCPAAARRPIRGWGVRTRHSGGHGDVPPPCSPKTLGMSSQCPA
jgi:hypothetical protein